MLVEDTYKTYNVPKIPKLAIKTLFVHSLTIACGPWTYSMRHNRTQSSSDMLPKSSVNKGVITSSIFFSTTL